MSLRKTKGKLFTKPSLTKQCHKDECDINTRVKLFIETGVGSSKANAPQYGDFDNEIDYQTSLNKVIQANEQFDGLPSKIRKKFNNSPSQLLQFLSDSTNNDEAIKLGLIPAPLEAPKPESTPSPAPTLPKTEEPLKQA